jgi:hypothetical protein
MQSWSASLDGNLSVLRNALAAQSVFGTKTALLAEYQQAASNAGKEVQKCTSEMQLTPYTK